MATTARQQDDGAVYPADGQPKNGLIQSIATAIPSAKTRLDMCVDDPAVAPEKQAAFCAWHHQNDYSHLSCKQLLPYVQIYMQNKSK